MNKVLFTLVTVGALFHQHVRAQVNCEEERQKLKASIIETMRSGEVPCSDKYNLGRFEMAEDGSDADQKQEELSAWLRAMSEDEVRAMMKCTQEMSKIAIEKVESEMNGDCFKKIKENLSKAARN